MWNKIKAYLWNLLIALDQLANALAFGYPDETFSCRTYRKAMAGQPFWRFACLIINAVFFWQADHCWEAYERETRRGHLPSEFTWPGFY